MDRRTTPPAEVLEFADPTDPLGSSYQRNLPSALTRISSGMSFDVDWGTLWIADNTGDEVYRVC